MSEETKRDAKNTEYHLRNAEISVNDAEKCAQKTGDKQLIQKVTTIKKTITETRKELNEKLGG